MVGSHGLARARTTSHVQVLKGINRVSRKAEAIMIAGPGPPSYGGPTLGAVPARGRRQASLLVVCEKGYHGDEGT